MNPLEKLLNALRVKEGLNSEFSCREREALFDLAKAVGPDAFVPVSEEVEKWMALFLESPQQRLGKEILREYFAILENGARQLNKSGEIALLPVACTGEAEKAETMSKAMILPMANLYSPLDRCKILNRTEVPQTLTRAADAFRRRIEVVDTVLETGFELLQTIDRQAFQRWILEYLGRTEGDLEPELVRDVLRVLMRADVLEEPLLDWAMRWSNDEALLEQWPYVVALSDKVLCREGLLAWQNCNAKRNGLLAHLDHIVKKRQFDEKHLLPWMTNALQEFGAGVHRVLSMKFEEDGETAKGWRSMMVRTELERLAAIYSPIMMICGETLTRPDGANVMAMACLGLIGDNLARWEAQVQRLAERVVLKVFLVDLKEGRKPVETIRRLTFGDKFAYDSACAELDLMSQAFDSVEQRNKVVKMLSYFYASYRRAPLLGQEISRRYRSLMRILHEDYLKNILTGEDYAAVENLPLLHDLSGLATSARRYLDHRRALNMTVEEMIASEIEFVQDARNRRMTVLRNARRAVLDRKI